MELQTCSSCQGRGRVTDFSQRIQTSPSYYKYGERACPSCGGTGQIYKSTPKRSTTGNRRSVPTGTANKQRIKPPIKPPISTPNENNTVQGIFALIGFLVGAILVYQSSDDNLIMAGIVGLVTGYVAGKWYKAIITIAIIIGIIYLVGSAN